MDECTALLPAVCLVEKEESPCVLVLARWIAQDKAAGVTYVNELRYFQVYTHKLFNLWFKIFIAVSHILKFSSERSIAITGPATRPCLAGWCCDSAYAGSCGCSTPALAAVAYCD